MKDGVLRRVGIKVDQEVAQLSSSGGRKLLHNRIARPTPLTPPIIDCASAHSVGDDCHNCALLRPQANGRRQLAAV